MTINDKSEGNYRGKCLGWPVTSYGGAFWQKMYPFYIPFIEKRYPFHIPTLGSLVLIFM